MININNMNIPNRIKQPNICCMYCGKHYIKKTSLDKHIILCELLNHAKRKVRMINEEEEEEPLPSPRKMYNMLIELGTKYNKLEEKMADLQKWVVKKKRKINILDWLNDNIRPSISFDKLVNSIEIDENDIAYIFENTFNDTLHKIIARNLNETLNENPIFAFDQKVNVFYIYSSLNGETTWNLLTKEKMIWFLNNIFIKIVKTFTEWKKKKDDEIKKNESLSLKCDKTFIKMMSSDFSQESILSKIKSMLFQQIKKDITSFIEYEFVF
jgi:uncharacterized protein YeeX (DUF496 family)